MAGITITNQNRSTPEILHNPSRQKYNCKVEYHERTTWPRSSLSRAEAESYLRMLQCHGTSALALFRTWRFVRTTLLGKCT